MDVKSEIFNASRERYGNNSVTYRGLELVASNKLDKGSVLHFNWGDTSTACEALAYAMLEKSTSKEIAVSYAKVYMHHVISKIKKDEWKLERGEVVRWVKDYIGKSMDSSLEERRGEDRRKEDRRVIRETEFQEEAKKRLKVFEERRKEDRRKEERRVQREVEFQQEAQKRLKTYELNKHYEEKIANLENELASYKKELRKYKAFVDSLDIQSMYDKYTRLL